MAENTPNLGLYKANPVTDENDTFNVDTMLNENWDKVDAGVKAAEDNSKTYTDQQVEAVTVVSIGAETPAGAQAKADAAEASANSYTDQQVGQIQLTADNVSVADSAGHFTANDVEGVLAELKQYANDGKQGIVTALIGVGQSTAQVTMTFAQLAALIEAISNFDASKLLEGTVVAGKAGTMADFAGEEITVAWHNHAFEIYPDPNDNRMGFIEIPNLQGGGHTGRVTPATKFVAQLWGLLPENIAAGKYIGQYDGYGTGQIYGTFTADANAGPNHILAGFWAYVNGVKVDGGMPNYGTGSYPTDSVTIDGTNLRFGIPNTGRYDDAGLIYHNEPNWIESNIPNDIPGMFGKVGTMRRWNGEKQFAEGTLVVGSTTIEVHSLTFRPRFVIAWRIDPVSASIRRHIIVASDLNELKNHSGSTLDSVFQIDGYYDLRIPAAGSNARTQNLSDKMYDDGFRIVGLNDSVTQTIKWVAIGH